MLFRSNHYRDCCLRRRGRLAPGRGLLRCTLGGARRRPRVGCAQNGTTVRGSDPARFGSIGATGWPLLLPLLGRAGSRLDGGRRPTAAT